MYMCWFFFSHLGEYSLQNSLIFISDYSFFFYKLLSLYFCLLFLLPLNYFLFILIKKKTLKKNQKLLKYFFKQIELKRLLLNSLRRNYFIPYVERITYFMATDLNRNYFFRCQQKLLCLFDISRKVPNKHFKYSRFFLNRKLNYLTISNTVK